MTASITFAFRMLAVGLAGYLTLTGGASAAAIERIAGGGVHIDLNATLPDQRPALLVFHTPWDQNSINLVQEVETWSEGVSGLTIFLIDVVDPRTQVYRQFNLTRLPTMMLYNDRHEDVAGHLYTLDDMQRALDLARLLSR